MKLYQYYTTSAWELVEIVVVRAVLLLSIHSSLCMTQPTCLCPWVPNLYFCSPTSEPWIPEVLHPACWKLRMSSLLILWCFAHREPLASLVLAILMKETASFWVWPSHPVSLWSVIPFCWLSASHGHLPVFSSSLPLPSLLSPSPPSLPFPSICYLLPLQRIIKQPWPCLSLSI
jgi:hypothetical protein